MNFAVFVPTISCLFCYSCMIEVMTLLVRKNMPGIVQVIFCIFIITGNGGCVKKITSNNNPLINNENTTTMTGSSKNLLALGDSYTIGQSVSEADRFPNQTINILRSAGIKLNYPATIIAQTGWTTQNLLDGIASATPPPVGPYDLVTLLIGVNNQYQHRDTAEYRDQFIQCLNKAIEFSGNRGNRVFVLSIPDYGATPFGSSNAAQISLEIDQFNAINKEVSLQRGVNYTDITPSTRQAVTDLTLVALDGLHPSGKEYAKWAEMLAPKMKPILR